MGGSNPTFGLSLERKKGKEKFYVVFEGRKRGVFDNWKECASQVDGFSSNMHRSYKSLDEVENAFEAYELGKAGSYDVASASNREGKESFVQLKKVYSSCSKVWMGGGNPTYAPSLERKKGEKIFYVVFEGRKRGISHKWEECASQVNGFPGNVHHSYKSWDEAIWALEAYELGKPRSDGGASTSKGEKESFVQLEKADNSGSTSLGHSSFTPDSGAMKRIMALELEALKAQQERDEAMKQRDMYKEVLSELEILQFED